MSLLSWEEYDKQFHLSEVLTHAARACVSSRTLLPETFLASYFTERVNKDAIEWIRCATTFTSHGICLQFTMHLYVNVEIVATTLPIHFTEEELLSYTAYINESNNKLFELQEHQDDNTNKEQNLEEEPQQQKLQKNQSSRKKVKKDGNRDNTSKSRNGLHSADQEQEMKEEINKVHNYVKLCSELKTLIEQSLLCQLQTVKVSDQVEWDNCLERVTFTIQRDNEQSANNNKDLCESKNNNINCEESEKRSVQITLPIEVQKVLSLMALQLAAQSRSMELYEYIYLSAMLKQIGNTQSNRDNVNDVNINVNNDADNEENLKTLQLPYLLIPFFGRFVEHDTSTSTNCVNGTNKNTNNSNNNNNNNNNNITKGDSNVNNYTNFQHISKGIVSFETLYIVVAPYKQQECNYESNENKLQTNNTLVNTMQETYESVVNYEFLIKLQRAVELFKTRFGEVPIRADGALLYDNFENITDAVNVAVELLEASGMQTGREVTLGICVNCLLSTLEHENVNIKGRTKGAKSMADDKKKGKASNNTNKEKKIDRSTPEVKKAILEQLNTNAEEEVDNMNNNNNNKETESVQEEFYYNLFPNDVEITGLQLTEYLSEQVEESKGLLTVIINSHNLNDNQGMCRLMRKVGNKVRLVCKLPEMELDDITHSSTHDNVLKDKEITTNNQHINTSLFVHDYITRFDSMPLVTQIVKQMTKIMEHNYFITSDISMVEHNVRALTNVAIGLQSMLLMIGGICSNTLQDICTTYSAIANTEIKETKCTKLLEMSETLINSEKYVKSLKSDNSENNIIPEIKRKNEKKQKKTAR